MITGLNDVEKRKMEKVLTVIDITKSNVGMSTSIVKDNDN